MSGPSERLARRDPVADPDVDAARLQVLVHGPDVGTDLHHHLIAADVLRAVHGDRRLPRRLLRLAVVVQPVGLSYASNDANTAPASFSPLTPVEATAAIDALQGRDWAGSPHAPPMLRQATGAGAAQLGSWWTSFWDWLKGVVATITHVIVSVAEEIYVGIRTIVDGVAYVFKQIIRVIEDVASAIATFFIKLGKLVADVIEALSVVFHFDEVIKTQQFLLKELSNRLQGVPGNPAYPGLAAAVKSTAIPKLDAFFEQGEKAINGFFDTLAGDVGGTQIDQLKGQGQTAHTAFTLTPKRGGQALSHAPQCTWAMQKLKTGAPVATGGRGLGQAAARVANGTNSWEAFIDGFGARLGQDGNLSAQWQQVRQGAQHLGHASSARDFITQGVAELLRVIALLLDGALAVANAFLDGVLGLVDSMLAMLLDAKTGLLTQPVDIPVLSWLYQELFGEPLTVLNALTLVAAIPLTMVWRGAANGGRGAHLGVIRGTTPPTAALRCASPGTRETHGRPHRSSPCGRRRATAALSGEPVLPVSPRAPGALRSGASAPRAGAQEGRPPPRPAGASCATGGAPPFGPRGQPGALRILRTFSEPAFLSDVRHRSW